MAQWVCGLLIWACYSVPVIVLTEFVPPLRFGYAQYMALPSGYGWLGRSAALFGRPDGLEQVFSPEFGRERQPRI